jgi:C-terminal processing protease CtpA/Prc
MLSGRAGTDLLVSIKPRGGAVRDVWLTRNNRIRESDAWVRDEMAPQDAIEMRMLPDSVAYVALNGFGDQDVVKRFSLLWPRIRNSRGMIIDLRRNPGGNSGVGWGIASFIISRPVKGHYSRTRINNGYRRANGSFVAGKSDGEIRTEYGAGSDRAIENRKYWDGTVWDEFKPQVVRPARGHNGRLPVVVLIGPNTGSAAEDFLVTLDSLRNVRLVGENTCGSTGQPLFISLPGGGGGRVCTMQCYYPDRTRSPVGTGITPHVRIRATIDDVLAGRDVVLDKGVEVLRSMAKK